MRGGGSNCMCIEPNFQFVFDGKSIDVGNGKRSKSSNEEEVALEAIYSKMRLGNH